MWLLGVHAEPTISCEVRSAPGLRSTLGSTVAPFPLSAKHRASQFTASVAYPKADGGYRHAGHVQSVNDAHRLALSERKEHSASRYSQQQQCDGGHQVIYLRRHLPYTGKGWLWNDDFFQLQLPVKDGLPLLIK